MKYKVTIAGYAICRPDIMFTLPPIPGTHQERIFDTNSPDYAIIWEGYQQLRSAQIKKPCKDGDWMQIKAREDAPHIQQFREALNIFMRFLAGEGRDNCNQVVSIELCEDREKIPA
ncbi:hypothetical protein H7X65_00775 [Candidatus Parcubacteria bacterium]|nr:hypothetical protein [Candidatus Parcubacteria bacterium]